jgi:hypothetical protein
MCYRVTWFLFKNNCAHWAGVCTSAAFNAGIRVDGVDISFGNGVYRATSLARTTSYTFFSNFISHSK